MTTSIEVETAASLRAQAQQLRAAAEEARTQREPVLAQAQRQADQILAEARKVQASLWQAAADADREATWLEERASALAEVEQVVAQVPEAQQRALDLAAEGEGLRRQIQELDDRISGHGDQRHETETALAAARNKGDVDAVVAAQTRLDAIGQVVGTLTGQRRQAHERATAIGGPDSGGELQRALAVLEQLLGRHRRALNQLDPDRPEAVTDQALENLKVALTANLQRIQEEQSAEPVRRLQVRG